MDEFCSKCDKQFTRGDNFIVPCSGFCRKFFHRKCCENLGEYDVKLTQKNRNLCYLCDDCVSGSVELEKKFINILTSQQVKYDKLIEVINELSNSFKNQLLELKGELLCRFDQFSDKNKLAGKKLSEKNKGSVLNKFKKAKEPTANCCSVKLNPAIDTDKDQLANQNSLNSSLQQKSVMPSCDYVDSALALALQTPAASNFSSNSTLANDVVFSSASLETGDWINVNNKKKCRKQQKVAMYGTADDVDLHSILPSVPNFKFLHISRLNTSVSVENIKNYLSNKLKVSENMIICNKLVSKDADISKLSFVNFKVGVPDHIFNSALSPDMWPVGIKIKNFVKIPKNLKQPSQSLNVIDSKN